MQDLLYILLSSVRLSLTVWYYLLLVRAVLSWLPNFENTFTDLIHAVTEPILAPVRNLFDRLGVSSAFPIDLSFLAVVLVLSLILGFL